jgi:tetratricopeptide (TPR) repeat protein
MRTLLQRTFVLAAVMGCGFAPLSARATDDTGRTGTIQFAQAQLSAEDIFWQTIQNSTDPAMFQAYLDQVNSGRFPGTYKSLAEIKINALKGSAGAPAPAPAAQPAPSPVAPPVRSADGVKSPDIDACDRAAAAPADREKPPEVPGVTYTSVDASAAIRACRRAVEVQGAPRRVFFQLARAMNRSGNLADAVSFYQKAVELGHPGAMHDMAGLMRNGGRGIKRDPGLAMALYEKAAATGLTESLVQLGAMYSDGKSGRQDYRKAIEYYQRAAEAKTPGAFTNLGVLYYAGRGVPRDSRKACEYWREGAGLGDDMAAKNLRRSCRTTSR